MTAQPYTKVDLEQGEEIVRKLHGLRGFDAWAECIAKAIAAERERAQIRASLEAEARANNPHAYQD